jgi:hypothetical protein
MASRNSYIEARAWPRRRVVELALVTASTNRATLLKLMPLVAP